MNVHVILNRRRTLGLAFGLLALGGVMFVLGRQLGGDDGAAARADSDQAPAQASLPGPEDTAVPGSTPDTSLPGWGLPYRNSDQALPRYDQQINGIAVGPSVEVASSGRCRAGEAHEVDALKAAGTPLAFDTPSLPPGASLDLRRATECDGTIVTVRHEYSVMAEPDAERKVRTGAASWFDVQHGGSITVSRSYKQFPAVRSSIASERWQSFTVGGLPAALGRPIIDRGFGPSLVVVWDESQQIQTIVSAMDMPVDVVIRIAEEVAR